MGFVGYYSFIYLVSSADSLEILTDLRIAIRCGGSFRSRSR